MKRIILVQLTRRGDLIQTLQAALGFDWSDAKLELLVHPEMYQGTHEILSPFFNEIHQYSDDDDASFTQNSYDQCINLSYCQRSISASGRIVAKERFGPFEDSGDIKIPDQWSQYIYGSVLTGIYNPFHLVDLFKEVIAKATGKTPGATPAIGESQTHELITIHPFSSSKKKNWGTYKWIEVIYSITQKYPNHEIAILGAPEEHEQADQICSAALLKDQRSRIQNRVGDLSIIESMELVHQSSIFIGHDSLVAHLAALGQVPSVLIYLGQARDFETFAYNPNAIVLRPEQSCYPCPHEFKCDHLSCHKDITSQDIISALQAHLVVTEIEYWDNAAIPVPQEHRLHLNGLGQFLSVRDLFCEYYRQLWIFTFNNEDVVGATPLIHPESAQELYSYLHGVSQLFELTNFGLEFSRRVLEEVDKDQADEAVVQNSISKIQEIDTLAQHLATSYPALGPLVNVFYVGRSQVPGVQLEDVAKNMAISYSTAVSCVSVVHDFLIQTLKLNEIPLPAEYTKEQESC